MSFKAGLLNLFIAFLSLIRSSLFVFTILITASCTQIDLPNEVKIIVNKHPSNRSELLKAIYTFKGREDSLKLRAAYYLIKNLDGWSYLDGKNLRNYVNYAKLIKSDYNNGNYIWHSLNQLYGPFSRDSLTQKQDLDYISAKRIVEDIDMAFKVWKEQPWGQSYSFDQFCEYILPLRLSNEYPDLSRKDIYELYRHVLDSSNYKVNIASACITVNNKLIADGWTFTQRLSGFPHFSAKTLIDYRTGNCRDMADYATYVMRAVGIPIGNDFVPQWLHRTNGHNWNVMVLPTGKIMTFMGAESNPGETIKPGLKKGKVYRHTFAIYKKSLGAIKLNDDDVPGFLNDPRIKDVTNDYGGTYSLDVKSEEQNKEKYGYLSVFNTIEWLPIDWSFQKYHGLHFSNLEGDIIYLPTVYKNKQNLAMSDPIYLSPAGKAEIMSPDLKKTIRNMAVDRIFPNNPEDFLTQYSSGVRIQGANKPDFSDAVDLELLSKKPSPFFNSIKFKEKDIDKNFRFIRYLAPEKFPTFSSLSEFRVYAQGRIHSYKVISHVKDTSSLQKKDFADGDFSTFYTFKEPGSWIAFDLGEKIIINQIDFATGMIKNNSSYIQKGHIYELFYFNKGSWVSVSKLLAKEEYLEFKNVPSNAVYLINDCTNPTKHQIFRYDVWQHQLW